MLRTRLKELTAADHARVEAALDLLDPALTSADLGRAVATLHAFWLASEPAIERWAHDHTALAARLRWPQRRRSAHLADDVRALGALGAPPAAVASALPALAGTADVLGWLYVAEGSTLGGALLSRVLVPLTDSLGVRLRSFAPYPDGPGSMWRDYLAVLAEWTDGDAARQDAVAAAALATFAALASWAEFRHPRIAA